MDDYYFDDYMKSEPKKSKKSLSKQPTPEPGEISVFLECGMRVADLPKIDMSDPVAVHDRIWEYFSICKELDQRPSFSGLALSFKMSRANFAQILCRGRSDISPKVREQLEQARDILESIMEGYMLSGRINPASGCFVLKNCYSWKDTTDIILTPGIAEPDQIPLDDLIQEAKLLED